MGSEVEEAAIALTEEQQQFLQQCNEEFAHRFTEQDEEFQKIKDLPDSVPPIIDPWYSRGNRNFDGNRHNRRRPYDRDRYDHNRDRYHDRYHDQGGSGPIRSFRYRDRRDRQY